MGLDEIEKRATDYSWACNETGNRDTVGAELARALLTVLPVVRAAERWRSIHILPCRENCDCGWDECELAQAVDAVRGGMGE